MADHLTGNIIRMVTRTLGASRPRFLVGLEALLETWWLAQIGHWRPMITMIPITTTWMVRITRKCDKFVQHCAHRNPTNLTPSHPHSFPSLVAGGDWQGRGGKIYNTAAGTGGLCHSVESGLAKFWRRKIFKHIQILHHVRGTPELC